MASIHTKKHKKKIIQHSDPGKILDLVVNLNDHSCALLQIKVNTYLAEECEADLALSIIVYGDVLEASIETVGQTALPRKNKIWMTPKFLEIMKMQVEKSDVLKNFGQDFQAIVGPYIPKDSGKKRFVLYPVIDKPFSMIVCIYGSKLLEENISNLIHECYLFVWPTLKKTIAYEYECRLKEKCQQLLKVAKILFTQVASLDTLLQIAMTQAKILIQAEHCSVKMVDVERMELVEASSSPNYGDKTLGDLNVTTGRRVSMDRGIAGLVLNSGTLINCRSPNDHASFDADIDTIPGVECKTLLCFPIREQSGIIGVGCLINKVGDPYFDSMDEEVALAFSVYCGVCITHSVVYRKIQEAHIRNALANELVMYHMQVGDAEVMKLLDCGGLHNHPYLNSLHFNLRALHAKELPCYVFKMFSDLGFDKKYQLKPQKLARFILHVKKGYRDVPYHSWYHAFNVGQWSYAALLNFQLVSKGYFNELQAFIFLIAGLVHDLDHRGTTNSFHLHGQTTLAALYSSTGSVMERHHLAQAMCILNTEGCDILESLTRRDYDRAINTLRDFILASDLANYFKNKNDYQIIAADFQKGNRVHNSALLALLMNAADLSDQLKDWGSVKKTAAAVLTEFFKQGDVEKSRGDLPADIMDRDKCFIPDLEIQFLTVTCIPLYTMLGKMIPKAAPCTKIIENHIERWEAAKPVFSEVPITAGLSVLLSPELDDLIEMNIKEKERLRLEAEAAAAAEAAGTATDGDLKIIV